MDDVKHGSFQLILSFLTPLIAATAKLIVLNMFPSPVLVGQALQSFSSKWGEGIDHLELG